VISSTWAIKKNLNGMLRARVNARGFMQVAGEHYNSDSISFLLTTEAASGFLTVYFFQVSK